MFNKYKNKLEKNNYDINSLCLSDEIEYNNLLLYISNLNDNFEINRIYSIMSIERNKLYSLIEKTHTEEVRNLLRSYINRCEIVMGNLKKRKISRRILKRC